MSSPWYVHKDGQQLGPYNFDQLAGEVQSGQVGGSDMVWNEGMGQWTRVDQVEGLNPGKQHHAGRPATRSSAASGYSNAPGREIKLEQLSKWMGFVGIITIIGGVISAISGVFAFVIGALPGVITIIMGVMLRKAKRHADAMMYERAFDSYSENFTKFVGSLNTYFKIMGILIIIGLILGVLGAIFSLIAGAALMNYIDTLDFF